MPALMSRLTLRHETLSNRDYHARPELGSSTLKTLDRDGAEMVVAKLDRPEQSDSRALAIGSAVHAVIDGTFAKAFQAAPDVRGYKTTDSDTFLAAGAELEASGVTLLSRAEFARVQACGDAIRRKLGTYLAGRQYWREPSLFWSEPIEGHEPLPCKCRPDLLVDHGDDSATYVEIKTTADNCGSAWRSSCWRYGYWIQQPHYEAGIKAATNCTHVRTVFVVVRSSSPYTVRCYQRDPIDAAVGERKWRDLLADYARRVRENDWGDDSFLSPTVFDLGMKIQDDMEDAE